MDNETYGEGNAYDFGERIYDPRLGRWFSVDPLASQYPEYSPYVFAYNNPIAVIDPDGRSGDDPRKKFYTEMGTAAIKAISSRGVENKFKALYVLAQYRVENGFNTTPPGNNPFNITGRGDAGSVSLKTKEYNSSKQAYSTTRNFASFSSMEGGFNAYMDLLQKNFPDAYAALTNENMTVADFANGMNTGRLGIYATNPNYAKRVRCQ
jgi:RHS repeat-associated protein